MSNWDDQVKQHRIWDEMKSLGAMIDAASKAWHVDPVALSGLERIRAILTLCGKRLAAVDPILIIPAVLDQIADALANATSSVNTFISDQNANNIEVANNYANTILSSSNDIPLLNASELEGLFTASSEFRSLSEDRLTRFTSSINELRTQIDSARQSIEVLAATLQTDQQSLAQAIGEHQRQFSDSQDKRLQDFSETIRQAQQDTAKVISDYQSQFSAAQERRGQDFSDAQGGRQEKFNELLSDYSKCLSEQQAEFLKASESQVKLLGSDYEKRAAKMLEEIRTAKEHVEALVGVIGNLGVTSGYLKTANQSRISMWVWQGLTVVSLGGLSILAYRTLPLLKDSPTWEMFAGRVLFLASLGVIAAYSGTQADKFFTIEGTNRKLALELEAIGPYLAPLPDDEQHRFRVEIGQRSFGREDITDKRQSPVSLLHLLKSKESKEVLNFLLDAIKKGKAE